MQTRCVVLLQESSGTHFHCVHMNILKLHVVDNQIYSFVVFGQYNRRYAMSCASIKETYMAMLVLQSARHWEA